MAKNNLSWIAINDQYKFLNGFIRFWENSNEPYGVKDLKSQFIYANQAFKDMLNLPLRFNLEGKLDSEMPAKTSEFADFFQQHDRIVEQTKKRISSLETHPFGREKLWQSYIFEKMPLYDENNEVAGTIFHARKPDFLPQLFLTNEQSSVFLTPPDFKITHREWEVLFLYCHRLTHKYIANQLKISIRTVESHIQSVKKKFNLGSKKEVIDFFYEHGWNNYIPPNLIRNRHIILG